MYGWRKTTRRSSGSGSRRQAGECSDMFFPTNCAFWWRPEYKIYWPAVETAPEKGTKSACADSNKPSSPNPLLPNLGEGGELSHPLSQTWGVLCGARSDEAVERAG